MTDTELGAGSKLCCYRLVEKLGEGGMGEIWKAQHERLARPAAIKLIRGGALRRQARGRILELRRRFELEAQATAALHSAHTVDLYDFGVAANGDFYYVMELLDGLDLQSLVEQYGALPVERAVHLLRQACDSLADAHHQAMVHRDIKPANIFTCRKGPAVDFVKVLDFGLVRPLQESPDQHEQLTVDGVVVGTPAFMAPEMIEEGQASSATDIYALVVAGKTFSAQERGGDHGNNNREHRKTSSTDHHRVDGHHLVLRDSVHVPRCHTRLSLLVWM